MMIELAIRMRQAGMEEGKFMSAKSAAVDALVSAWGIGPEREFTPFVNSPTQRDKVYVGMTRYRNHLALLLAMLNLRVLRYLPKFIKMQDIITGVFIEPEENDFDYVNFGKGQSVTEICVVRPKGINKKEFLKLRKQCLDRAKEAEGITSIHSFKSLWGFKNADVFVHFVIYRDQVAFENIKLDPTKFSYLEPLNSKATSLIACSCTNLK